MVKWDPLEAQVTPLIIMVPMDKDLIGRMVRVNGL